VITVRARLSRNLYSRSQYIVNPFRSAYKSKRLSMAYGAKMRITYTRCIRLRIHGDPA